MNDNANFTSEDVMEKDFIINDVTPDDKVGNSSEDNSVLKEASENQNNLEESAEDAVEVIQSNPSENETTTPDSEEEKTSDSTVLLSAIQESLLKLEEKFDKKIAEDTHKNSLFDKMYEELASYKKDLYAKLVSPFINETISLLNDYERVIERVDKLEKEEIIEIIKGIPGDLENMLEVNGVERFSEETEFFNPRVQRAVKTMPTGDIESDNKIAERIRKGYRWNQIMLKPEMVKIFKYKEGYLDPTTDSPSETQVVSNIEESV